MGCPGGSPHWTTALCGHLVGLGSPGPAFSSVSPELRAVVFVLHPFVQQIPRCLQVPGDHAHPFPSTPGSPVHPKWLRAPWTLPCWLVAQCPETQASGPLSQARGGAECHLLWWTGGWKPEVGSMLRGPEPAPAVVGPDVARVEAGLWWQRTGRAPRLACPGDGRAGLGSAPSLAR